MRFNWVVLPLLALAGLPVAVPAAGTRDMVEVQVVGVANAGTRIELVKDGFNGTEGPLPEADGGLLFTENRAGRVIRIGPDDAISTWGEGFAGANALARMPDGSIVATNTEARVIVALKPGEPPRVLASQYQGRPFIRPNDLTVTKGGLIYFTDTRSPTGPAGDAPNAVYMVKPDGEVVLVTTDIARPNGIVLSPDERRLYVANTAGDQITYFSLDKEGLVTAKNVFARLRMPQDSSITSSGADGMAVDERGRLYVATSIGVQVFSARGEALGVIGMPGATQNLAFSGPKKAVLYVVGGGAVYRISTETRGPRREGK